MQWKGTSNPWTPAKIRAGSSVTFLSLVVYNALSSCQWIAFSTPPLLLDRSYTISRI
jgi:hypothetical protein